MYTPNSLEIAQFNLACAARFVEFWRQFYDYRVKVLDSEVEIDYFAELNIGKDLNEENVRRLLRWKDPHQLTHRILSGSNKGQQNSRVLRVLRCLTAINRFRNEKISEDEIRRTVEGVFPQGLVYGVFLLHIARPHSHPIADQHVFRACCLHTGIHDEQSWRTYDAYREYFSRIAQAIGVVQTRENIPQLKDIDNALMVFGQFLKAYYRTPTPEGILPDAFERSTLT
jgi:hypothetical protein